MHTAYIADNEVSFAEKENITEFLKDVGALLQSFPLSVYLFFFNGQYFSKHFSFKHFLCIWAFFSSVFHWDVDVLLLKSIVCFM